MGSIPRQIAAGAFVFSLKIPVLPLMIYGLSFDFFHKSWRPQFHQDSMNKVKDKTPLVWHYALTGK